MLFNINEASLAASQKHERLTLVYSITDHADNAVIAWAGNTFEPKELIDVALVTTGGVTITQSDIDAVLGSTNEVLATAFGTTAMVADNAALFIINCGGQIAHVSTVKALISLVDGTCGMVNGVGTKTALTDADFSATPIQCYVTSNGNLAIRIYYANISLATSGPGYIVIDLDAVLK